jgi:nifR3 family TIM-barrel protein
MIRGFWANLDRPIMAMAPLAGVTDAAFRPLIAKYGKPDVLFTEFVSCDGLCSVGQDRLLPDFWYDESERPIVAQIFGSRPENFLKTAQLCVELGFDGIDINTGCPDRNVEKQGAGSALIKNPPLMKEIIRATMEGAGDLPVSIKTRLGYSENIIGEWLAHLLEERPVAVTIHARTRAEMSNVPARWDAIADAVRVAREMKSETLILGNGDVKSLEHAHQLAEETGADGVMIGRGIFGNPWLFNRDVLPQDISPNQRLEVMLEHARHFEEKFQGRKRFEVLRRHFKWYVQGFDNAKTLRVALMAAQNADDVAAIVGDYRASAE